MVLKINFVVFLKVRNDGLRIKVFSSFYFCFKKWVDGL